MGRQIGRIAFSNSREATVRRTHDIVDFLKRLNFTVQRAVNIVGERFAHWAVPIKGTMTGGIISDVFKSKQELIAENALLRQQLIVVQRQIKRPKLKWCDRLVLVLLASKVRTWPQALLLIKPATALRWHRDLFRFFGKRKSASTVRKSRVAIERIMLIKQMARENRLWERNAFRESYTN
jgi:hypothetical protein